MLILMGPYGRLGNRLWTYANILAFAIEKKLMIIAPAFKQYEKYFVLGRKQADCRTNVSGSNIVNQTVIFAYKLNLRVRLFPRIELGEATLLNLETDSDVEIYFKKHHLVFLSGFYFVAPLSLIQHQSYIRQYFFPVSTINTRITNLINKARSYADILIGIHMRQRDYRTFCDGIMFYTAEEYADVMRCLAEQLAGKHVAFLVCSDEIQDKEQFKNLTVFFGTGHLVEDMYALGHCDFILGPNSTFSQWASFWGNVPLHVLNWKVSVKYGNSLPIFRPNITTDFNIYSPLRFGDYSERTILFADLIPKIS